MKRLLALVLLALGFGLGTAHANPLDMYGFGGRAGGMAGAQTAATTDGGANYYNPAALARMSATEIDVSLQLARPHLTMNGGDQHVDDSLGWGLSLAVPGKVLGHVVAFGLAAFVPDAHVTRTRAQKSSLPRWVLYDNRPQRLFVGFNLAFALLHERVLVGGGVAFLAQLTGTLDLAGRVGFPTPDDSELALTIDVNVRSLRYPQAGVLVHATPWLDLGVSYRGGFVLTIDQTLSIRGDVGPASEPVIRDAFFQLHSISLDHFQPAQVSAGFAARLTRRVLLAGDVTWQHWGAYRNPAADIDLVLDLKDFNDRVHLAPKVALPGAFFHDVVVPRLGVEVLVARGAHATWRARGGYAYEASPAPEQEGETNFIDGDKHTFTLGLGLELAHLTEILPLPFHIDLYGGLTWLPDRTHAKLLANDPVGDIVAGGAVWQLGLGTRWQF